MRELTDATPNERQVWLAVVATDPEVQQHRKETKFYHVLLDLLLLAFIGFMLVLLYSGYTGE